jgi:hypothetical protein
MMDVAPNSLIHPAFQWISGRSYSIAASCPATGRTVYPILVGGKLQIDPSFASAHACPEVVGLQEILPVIAAELATLIRMHGHRFLGLLHCTSAGSTPLCLDHRSFAVSYPLALLGSAFYPILVQRPAVSLHASSPQSVTLPQLRFASFAVINLRRDLHPQEYAHAGRI